MIKWLRKFLEFNDTITALEKAVDVEYQSAVELKKATIDGESKWMLEKKKNAAPVKFECDCKEVK